MKTFKRTKLTSEKITFNVFIENFNKNERKIIQSKSISQDVIIKSEEKEKR